MANNSGSSAEPAGSFEPLFAFFLLITPGPGVLTTAGVGSLLVEAALVTGLAAFLLPYSPLRTVLLGHAVVYLLYIAYRIATTRTDVAIVAASRPLKSSNGIALQTVNPKAYAVMTTFLPGSRSTPRTRPLKRWSRRSFSPAFHSRSTWPGFTPAIA